MKSMHRLRGLSAARIIPAHIGFLTEPVEDLHDCFFARINERLLGNFCGSLKQFLSVFHLLRFCTFEGRTALSPASLVFGVPALTGIFVALKRA